MTVAHERVWEALADLRSHPEWMKDAVGLTFTGDQTTGVGTLMDVETRIGPLRTVDVLEVTDWVDGEMIGVEHRGLVTGTGRLSVAQDGKGALVSWTEDLVFPWWLGGPVTAWIAAPVLRSVWRGNLERLEETLSAP